MNNNTYRIGVYRSLRKLGVKKEEISENLDFSKDLFFDETDWRCFLFLVESRTHLQFDDSELKKVNTVKDILKVMEN